MTYRRVGSMEKAVRAALTAKPPLPADAATAELALTLAQAIDSDGVDYRMSSALLAALEALQMSPRARSEGRKVVTDDKPTVNPIDQLAARRRGRAPTVDAGATGPV